MENWPIKGRDQRTSEYGVVPPMLNWVAFPLIEGEDCPGDIDQVTPGHDEEQMS